MLAHKRAKLYVNPITKQSPEPFLPTIHKQIQLVQPSVPSSLLNIPNLNDHQQQSTQSAHLQSSRIDLPIPPQASPHDKELLNPDFLAAVHFLDC